MEKPMMKKAAERKHQRRKAWQKAVSLMAAIAVFFTTYATILPAIALDDAAYCGREEHQHIEECYEKKLVCEWADMVVETPAPHVHTDACIVEQRVLACDQVEATEKPAVTHNHTDECYSMSRELTCGMEEIADKPAVTHNHTDECYSVSSELTCGMEESAGHTHSDACIQVEKVMECVSTEEGHVHSDACDQVKPVLECTITEEGHEHTDACYKTEQKYICGMQEGEGAHTHTDACYTETTTLTCGLEEGEVVEEAVSGHTHTNTCYTESKTLICGLEEGAVIEQAVPGHEHTEACYTVTMTMECPPPTETPASEHIHSEACYERVLICAIPEHVHELICYSDPNADVETSDVWDRSVQGATITGEWGADLVAVANTQIGYTESTKNYQVDNAGRIKGYTRYGAWCGQSYEDWSAMFVSFCLNYAEVPEGAFPRELSVAQWMSKLEEAGMYQSRSEADPKSGDVVFFVADHMGIVSAVSGGTIDTIEGDSQNSVETKSYSANSDEILGYGIMPENPALAKPTEEPTAEPTETVKPTEEPTVEPTETVKPTEEPGTPSDLMSSESTEAPATEDADSEVEYSCGLEEHTHTDSCYDEAGNLICGYAQEHEHSAECVPPVGGIAMSGTGTGDPIPADVPSQPRNLFEHVVTEQNGNFTIVFEDRNGDPLQKNENDQYVLTEGKTYIIKLSATNFNNLPAGQYYVKVAKEIAPDNTLHPLKVIDNQESEIDADAINEIDAAAINAIDAGTWSLMKDEKSGETWMVFDINENLAGHSELVMNAEIEWTAEHSTESMEFDGGITVKTEFTEAEFPCGLEEHTHTDTCYDEEGNLICDMQEHEHTLECLMMGGSEFLPQVYANGESMSLSGYVKTKEGGSFSIRFTTSNGTVVTHDENNEFHYTLTAGEVYRITVDAKVESFDPGTYCVNLVNGIDEGQCGQLKAKTNENGTWIDVGEWYIDTVDGKTQMFFKTMRGYRDTPT